MFAMVVFGVGDQVSKQGKNCKKISRGQRLSGISLPVSYVVSGKCLSSPIPQVTRPATKRFHTSDWRPLEVCCRPWTWWCNDATALAGYANLMTMMMMVMIIGEFRLLKCFAGILEAPNGVSWNLLGATHRCRMYSACSTTPSV